MKKMRRLIPAVAMLMVAAVMLSTASFAWFTMNDSVEATGMTIQAKSTGSLVIDTAPLTAASTAWEVKFDTLGNKKLAPVSYGTYKAQGATTETTGWFDAYDSAEVDPMTGAATSFKEATLTDGANYFDYVVYVGLASESEVKNIQVELNTDSLLHIAGAYAVAFYVDNDITDDTAINMTTPVTILHCAGGEEGVNAIKTAKLFNSAVTIPSTVGVDGTKVEAVGIQVVMRVFIDGNLKDGGEYVPQVATYKAATGSYNPQVSYFVEAKDDAGETIYVPATINENDYTEVADDGTVTYKQVNASWFVFDKYVNDTDNARDTYFVNNSYAPNAPSALNVSFKLVD